MKQEITIPPNLCKGCADRDEIIRSLAARVDVLEGRKPEFSIEDEKPEPAETLIFTAGVN